MMGVSNGDVQSVAHTVLFVCLHGSAKSLIAARHFSRLAASRALPWRGESSGIEPDAGVPQPVIRGLATDGIDVRGYSPRTLSAEQMEAAARVVSFGCDLVPSPPTTVIAERWDDLPLVSEGYDTARDAIIVRVTGLLDHLQEQQDRNSDVS